MTTPNTEPQYEQRASIGSIRFRWRPLHSLLFVLQSLTGIIFIIWLELAWETGDGAADTVKAIQLGITVVCGSSVGITAVISEGMDLVLGTRDAINEWLKKRRDEAKAEGIKMGHAAGIAEGIELGRTEGRAEGVNRGIELGRTEGRAEGVNEGIELGRTEGIVRGRVEGVAEAHAEGHAAGVAETLAWLKRRDEARENDEPFDEPPPGSDKP